LYNISGQNVNFVQGGPKTGTLFVRLIFIASTSSNIGRFSNILLSKSEEHSTTPQMCSKTTFWNVSVLKTTIEKKTTSITFKKLITGNDVFIATVII